MVTSAAVPAVVGTAMVNTACLVVGATPSRLTTSANSGFVAIMPMPFAVSMALPPPTATMQSAPLALNAVTPACTFSMVGLGLMSLNISHAMPASSSRSVTFFVTPKRTRSASVATNAFENSRRVISPGISLIAPAPW